MRWFSIAIILLATSTLHSCGGIGGSIASGVGGNVVGGTITAEAGPGGGEQFTETPEQIRNQGLQGTLVFKQLVEKSAFCSARRLDQVSRPFKYFNKVEILKKGRSAIVLGAVRNGGGSSYVIDFESKSDGQSIAKIFIAENVIFHRDEILENIRNVLSRCQ